jgi:hypothetical protein
LSGAENNVKRAFVELTYYALDVGSSSIFGMASPGDSCEKVPDGKEGLL